MITTNYYKGSPPRRPPSSRARVFARPRTPRSPNARDPIPSPAKKNTARTRSMFAPVARAPSSNPLPLRVVALTRRRSSTPASDRRRPRAVVRRHARRPPSRRVARARERARARAVDDRAPVVRERPERAAQGALPVARPDEPEQLEGGARACRDLVAIDRDARSIALTPRRARAIDRSE